MKKRHHNASLYLHQFHLLLQPLFLLLQLSNATSVCNSLFLRLGAKVKMNPCGGGGKRLLQR